MAQLKEGTTIGGKLAETVEGAQAKADAAQSAAQAYAAGVASAAEAAAKSYADNALAAHANRTDNPHQVTAAQLGLGDVLTHLAQILDSRIVDHNLDVATAQGRYVRLDNGLQICYGEKTFTDLNCSIQISTSGWYINLGLTAYVTLPAQFVSRNDYEAIAVERQGGTIFELKGLGVAFCYKDSAGGLDIYVSRFGSGEIPNTKIGWIAIGRWK